MLIKSVFDSQVACVCVKHINNADDMFILALSSITLHALFNICSDFANLNDIVYNLAKKVCMTFCLPYFIDLRNVKLVLCNLISACSM